MDGARLLAECLKHQGATHMYGIVGVPVIPIAEQAQAVKIEYIGFRNEQAASYAAGIAGYLTQNPGVCLTVSGPGMIHAIAGLANAQVNCWPLIVISGANETDQNGMGAFQEAPTIESARLYTKYAARISNVERIPFFVEKAYRMALYGRPGPVYLELPADVINAKTDFDLSTLVKYQPIPLFIPPTESLTKTLQLLSSAKRPLVVIGKGAAYAQAENELKEFVEKTGLPFLPTPMGKGVVSDVHPNCVAAARTDVLLGADVIFLIGARLNWMLHFGASPRFAADVKFVHIEICPEEIGQNRQSEIDLVGDIKEIIKILNKQLDSNPIVYPRDTPWWNTINAKLEKNRKAVAELMKNDQVPMTYYRALKEVSEALPQDCAVISEGANTMDISRTVVQTHLPRNRLDAGTFGTMGIGIPFCIAAAIHQPHKKVVAIQGDSAFGFSAMELEVTPMYPQIVPCRL
eukprot:TRINITY_DN1351_c0_g1_i1.p1 TRINITY_DN1351_c0_g1~~TRINITY_DN1351_c0_g1_i1.p1  ORF type:complete len:470 (-),score=154.28 TRINITY_DN1351_c0_g1_i1:411-1796(-)